MKHARTSGTGIHLAETARIRLGPVGKTPAVHKVQKLLGSRRNSCRWLGLTHAVPFHGTVKECLVLYDRTAGRKAELVTHQVVLIPVKIGEPVLGSQRLNAVVLKQRTMPLVGPALQNGVGNEASALAVFRGETVGDDAVLLNRIRRDAGVCAALVIVGDLATASLALLIVIGALDQVASRSLTRPVNRCASVVVIVISGRNG